MSQSPVTSRIEVGPKTFSGKKSLNNIENNMIDDVGAACFDFRCVAPIIILIAFYIGYHTSIAQHHVQSLARTTTVDIHSDLALIRPIMSTAELIKVKHDTFMAETKFQLPYPSHDLISVRFHSAVDSHGNVPLPDLFYDGVTFGITSENSHKTLYSSQNVLDLEELRNDLLTMSPRPTHVMNRTVRCNVSNWEEVGFAAYFSYSDLKAQGKFSSDKLQPWKRVSEDVMRVARKFKQFYITVWYPSEFGVLSNDDQHSVSKAHSLKTIIQQTLPTRTGLNELKSTGVVWLSAVNRTRPSIRKQTMYQKDWSEEDHWSMYRGEVPHPLR